MVTYFPSSENVVAVCSERLQHADIVSLYVPGSGVVAYWDNPLIVLYDMNTGNRYEVLTSEYIGWVPVNPAGPFEE